MLFCTFVRGVVVGRNDVGSEDAEREQLPTCLRQKRDRFCCVLDSCHRHFDLRGSSREFARVSREPQVIDAVNAIHEEKEV